MDPRSDDTPEALPAVWTEGTIPANVVAGAGTMFSGGVAFKRFRSQRAPAMVVGAHCTMDGVQFALGPDAYVEIGDYCYFTNAVLLCELTLRIGRYVVIGWNTTIADTDFHPIAPALRIADAVAVSPLGQGRERPPIPMREVVIEDDVWIGPGATILKGVRIGAGAFIEPGTLVTKDVAPRSRVAGNPAVVVGTV